MGRPDLAGVLAGFAAEDREVRPRVGAEREAVCRAVGRGLFFISADNNRGDLEGTIILRGGRAVYWSTGILPA